MATLGTTTKGSNLQQSLGNSNLLYRLQAPYNCEVDGYGFWGRGICSYASSSVKWMIWNASTKAIVANSLRSSTAGVYNVDTHRELTYPNPKPQLVGGSYYYFGIIGHTNNCAGVYYSTVSVGHNTNGVNSYASPTNASDAGVNNRRYSFHIEVTQLIDPGPDLLIEGITPAKFEYTDWGDLSDVK